MSDSRLQEFLWTLTCGVLASGCSLCVSVCSLHSCVLWSVFWEAWAKLNLELVPDVPSGHTSGAHAIWVKRGLGATCICRICRGLGPPGWAVTEQQVSPSKRLTNNLEVGQCLDSGFCLRHCTHCLFYCLPCLLTSFLILEEMEQAISTLTSPA